MSDKKITIAEFRCWLEGVEEMQDEAWVPSPTQWKRIRDKLNTIDDTPPPAPAPVAVQHTLPTVWRSPEVEAPIQIAPSAMVGLPVPRAPAQHTPLTGPFANPDVPQMPVRTPTIDTSNGNYQSTFA